MVGTTAGLALGAVEGVGDVDGITLGPADGIALGAVDGIPLEIRVTDGIIDGTCDGRGVADGKFEGNAVEVGKNEGSTVVI